MSERNPSEALSHLDGMLCLSAGLRPICQPADFVLVAVWLVRNAKRDYIDS